MYIFDNFIKNTDLLEAINEDKDFNKPGYMWWPGWGTSWPDTVKKQIITTIWCGNPIIDIKDTIGFEYWVNTMESGQDKKIHFDKDEASKTLISPLIGCIYYPREEEFGGGFLEIYEEKEPTRIKAKFNRLIIFDVGRIPHAVSTVTGGTRTSMAINLWNKKPSHLN